MDQVSTTDLFILFNSASLCEQMRHRYGPATVDENLRRTFRETFEKNRVLCQRFGVPLTTTHVDRMIAMTRDHDLTFEDIGKAGGNEFSQRLGDELSLLLFLRVFPTQARYYKEPLKGWEAAVSKFPSAKFDVEEAGRCLALDRYTAAVMHAMRVLEVGLTALAAHYGISTKRENWHEVLVGVEKKVSSLGPKDGKNWQDERQFGSEACVQFRHFKDAWRNHAMHVRQTFDETRARSIYDHVREFMEHLATRLKERRRL